jgi:MFS family permease
VLQYQHCETVKVLPGVTSKTIRSGWADVLADGRASRLALICLGVWLNAADSLVSATIMPTVAAQLGGYAYFSWATAGFLVGAILAGASAGRLSEKYGLRVAITFSGLVFTIGCVISAMAPDMVVFLLGRFVQGIGSGCCRESGGHGHGRHSRISADSVHMGIRCRNPARAIWSVGGAQTHSQPGLLERSDGRARR